ncbi:MAG: phosphotransferase enzyme family protein [Tepidisphaerales bacterium]
MSGPASQSPTPASKSSGRETFATDELAIVLSHYDIGVIESVQEFPRGSRKAPKLLITAEQGRFLLKRRAKGKDDPFKVAFCHALQLHLAHRQFPLPHLIGTRRDNNSMLQWRGHVYELFEYIPGQPFPETPESAGDSGRVLGLFHKLLLDFESPWAPPVGAYHNAPSVESGLKRVPAVLEQAGERHAAGNDGRAVRALLEDLQGRYRRAADAAEALGISSWPGQIVHADWHPGNMLFRDNHVVAVIDYDSARLTPRVIDVANGVLQFSILGGEGPVTQWPDHLDETRFRRFIQGYDTVDLLTRAELDAVPWLMVEALIAEAVLPIAITGTFGHLDGVNFLKMVQRKAAWIETHGAGLVQRLSA